jgi:hypothetical protein
MMYGWYCRSGINVMLSSPPQHNIQPFLIYTIFLYDFTWTVLQSQSCEIIIYDKNLEVYSKTTELESLDEETLWFYLKTMCEDIDFAIFSPQVV